MNDVFQRSVGGGGGLSVLFFFSVRALCLHVKGGKFIEELELDICSFIWFIFGIVSDGLGGDTPETSSK